MSNNPFTNNRFNFLGADVPINKTEKKQKNYESEKKTFTRDSDRRDNFKSKFREKDSKKPIEFNFQDEMFPDLVPSSNKIIDNTSTNFKDTLNTAAIEEEFTGLKPGWIELYKESGKNVINHGALTSHEIRIKQLELLEDDPHYIMSKAIHFVMTNRNKYINEYDIMYGEGAYNEKFVMPEVYGPEYDTEEDEYETYSESYDDNDYSDVYDDNF